MKTTSHPAFAQTPYFDDAAAPISRNFDAPGSLPGDLFGVAKATPAAPSNDATYRAITKLHGKYRRYVPIADAVATMSRMDGTKVGCIVLGRKFQILATGWNDPPRRSKAREDGRMVDRDARLLWVVHAEANAVANAANSGANLEGSTLICTLMPCMACAKLIVQAGVIRVMCPDPGQNDKWGREFDAARKLFDECLVELVHYDTSGE